MAWLEETLYPARCVACEQPGAWLCRSCKESIHLYDQPLHAPPLPSGRALTVSRVFSLASYTQKPWSALITSMKYDGLTDVQVILQDMMATYKCLLEKRWLFADGAGWCLVLIPTNPDHIEERGSDHMQVWAEVIRSILPKAIVCSDLLWRRSGTAAHASLDIPGAREAVIQDVFRVNGTVPSKVLLIDDVYTTGATLQTAAACLLQAGGKQIEVLTAAASFFAYMKNI